MRLITLKAAFLVVFASLCAGKIPDASAQSALHSPFEDRLDTVAGELKVVELERNCRYEVTLNGESLVTMNCRDDKDVNASAPIPQILIFSRIPVKPYAEVVVVQQQMVGNACNGGPIWLLGLKSDGNFRVSKSIEFCGGIQPSIILDPDRIVISIPGGTRSRGKGQVPPEKWLYRNGEVMRLRCRRRVKVALVPKLNATRHRGCC